MSSQQIQQSVSSKQLLFASISLGALFSAKCIISHFRAKKVIKNTSIKAIGIEIGGTGISVGFGTVVYGQSGEVVQVDIIQKKYFRTSSTPENNMSEIAEYIKQFEYEHIGIASFGPLCLNKLDTDYGKITTAPKPGWCFFPVVNSISNICQYNGRVGFDTDVNACALSEFKLGKHPINNNLVYVTVGTGVGIGLIINGQPVHGLMHPEGGHMIVPNHPSDQNFQGVCSFHQNCLEGMVTNVSIAKRKGLKDVMEVQILTDDDEIWDVIAYYLAIFCCNLAYVCSPEVIVLGGGIMNRTILYSKIKKEMVKNFNDYMVLYKKTAEEFIQPPKCGNNVGIIGAMIL